MNASRDNEARFCALVEASAQIVWATDANGLIVEDSPSWRTYTGQTFEEWRTSGWLDCVHPDDRESAEGSWQEAVRNRRPFYHEYRIRHVSGEWRWTAGGAVPLVAPDGKTTGWVGMNTDITERKNVEMERDRANALLTTILDSSPDVILAKDHEGRHLALNEAAARIIGLPVSEVLGQTDREIAKPEVAGPIMEVDREVMHTGKTVSIEEHYPDPSGRPLFFQSIKAPLLDEFGVPAGIVVVARDVTKQKQAEEALRRSEEEFRTLADNISQLAWMTDESGSIFWYNQRWYDYTGTTLETMRGWGWQTVHHPSHVERVVAHIKHCFETGKTWEDTFPLRGKDGAYRWFLSHALPIRDEKGRILRWFGTNTDITQRLKTEQELRRANDDLEQFAYSVSHDLQEPLRSVSIYSELLIRRCGERLDGEAQELLRYLAEGAARMEALVGDLLEYTRVVKLDVSTDKTDANAVLATVLSNLAETIAALDARVISGELPEVRASAVHLQQIFQNLISNALRYRGREHPVVHVEAGQHDGGYALFSVKDNGIGFEPQYKEQIFGLFKRLHNSTEYPGTGLGLAICRRIIERYRGRIWAESSPGEGSTFYFTLPRRLPRMRSHHARGGQQGGRVSHAGGAGSSQNRSQSSGAG
jgi:PAS domain S-box-containing protein